MSSATISATNPRPSESLVVGPLFGYFVSCTVEQSLRGFVSTGAVARSESAFGNGDQLSHIEVGPFPSANLALAMLVSHVRWTIENRSGPFSGLA